MPFVKIRDLEARYMTIAKGMKRDHVIEKMGRVGYSSEAGLNAWWDDKPLGREENSRVESAIRYTVKTFFLPVTFEFTFDGAGEVVGRHRYD